MSLQDTRSDDKRYLGESEAFALGTPRTRARTYTHTHTPVGGSVAIHPCVLDSCVPIPLPIDRHPRRFQRHVLKLEVDEQALLGREDAIERTTVAVVVEKACMPRACSYQLFIPAASYRTLF